MPSKRPGKAAKPARASKAAKKAARPTAKPKKTAAKPKKAAAKRAAPKRSPAKAAKPKPAAPPAAPAAEEDSWVVVSHEDQGGEDPWLQPQGETWEIVDAGAEPAPAEDAGQGQWAASSTPSPATPTVTQTFDSATGDWLTMEARPAEAQVETLTGPPPEAPRHGPGPTFWTVVLWLDIAFLAINAVFALYAGIVLVFQPESDTAAELRDAVRIDSPEMLWAETMLMFTLFGLIPLVWVMMTRQDPKEGTKRYLHLHSPGKGILRGVLLTLPLLLAVFVLSAVYIVATEGADALTDPEEDANPAVQGILDNLSWPLAVAIALSAGIGEEIFFRGVLQRWLGVGGQAALFGLAHAAGGYIPQILFAVGLGLLFGFLLKRGWSLWTMITAHVLYDLVLLAIGMASKTAA